MRKVVFQMMTTLNGTINDPDGWVSGISDDLYAEINRIYATFDTILVGRATYAEMVSYWPGAASDSTSTEIVKSMAHKMNTYKKFVFSRSPKEQPLEWNNAELVSVQSDDDLISFVTKLKNQSGGDIHLAGGAGLAQSVIRLGLVDEYHFFLYPVVANGSTWFDQLETKSDLKLVNTTAYENGVVGLYYTAK